jgi:hypothetical protein
MAEFTVGASTTGANGRIRLFKNGAEIADETYAIIGRNWNKLSVCLVPDDVNTIFDLFFADVNDQADDNSVDGEGVLAATTANGNKCWAVGTGDCTGYVNIRGAVLYHTKTLDDDTACTPCYTEPECPVCPGGDGMDTGVSFEISGFTTPYGGSCSCEASFNATYNIAGSCGGEMSTLTLCEVGSNDYYLYLKWYVAQATNYYWFLYLEIGVMQYVDGINDTELWWAKYIEEFDDYTLCRSINEAELTLHDYRGLDVSSPCEGLTSLTVEATAY